MTLKQNVASRVPAMSDDLRATLKDVSDEMEKARSAIDDLREMKFSLENLEHTRLWTTLVATSRSLLPLCRLIRVLQQPTWPWMRWTSSSNFLTSENFFDSSVQYNIHRILERFEKLEDLVNMRLKRAVDLSTRLKELQTGRLLSLRESTLRLGKDIEAKIKESEERIEEQTAHLRRCETAKHEARILEESMLQTKEDMNAKVHTSQMVSQRVFATCKY